MTRWIARQSASGDLYEICTDSTEETAAFRLFGEKVLGMGGDFDIGNVDIDLFLLAKSPEVGAVVRIEDQLL